MHERPARRTRHQIGHRAPGGRAEQVGRRADHRLFQLSASMATASFRGVAIKLPHAILLDIPQEGHVTLITLGRSRERSRTSSTTGSTPHRGHALNSTSLKVTALSHLPELCLVAPRTHGVAESQVVVDQPRCIALAERELAPALRAVDNGREVVRAHARAVRHAPVPILGPPRHPPNRSLQRTHLQSCAISCTSPSASPRAGRALNPLSGFPRRAY